MTTIIDAQDAIAALREVRDTFGKDHVDPDAAKGRGCDYAKRVENEGDGEEGTQEYCPACIVGQALFLRGVSAQWLYEHNGTSLDVVFTLNMDEEESVQVTRAAAMVFRIAQQHQDGGGTWGEAMSRAYELARWFDEEEIR